MPRSARPARLPGARPVLAAAPRRAGVPAADRRRLRRRRHHGLRARHAHRRERGDPRAVDIGTNGEVVMGSRERLCACSAPAGPALEGAQIRHGMRAAARRHRRVCDRRDDLRVPIGDAAAQGICGSGLIDACAMMLDARVIDSTGLIDADGRDAAAAAAPRPRRSGGAGDQFVCWCGRARPGATTTSHSPRPTSASCSSQERDLLRHRHAARGWASGRGRPRRADAVRRLRQLPVDQERGADPPLPPLPADRISYMGNAAAIGAQMACCPSASGCAPSRSPGASSMSRSPPTPTSKTCSCRR